jgi:hypothetical protein
LKKHNQGVQRFKLVGAFVGVKKNWPWTSHLSPSHWRRRSLHKLPRIQPSGDTSLIFIVLNLFLFFYLSFTLVTFGFGWILDMKHILWAYLICLSNKYNWFMFMKLNIWFVKCCFVSFAFKNQNFILNLVLVSICVNPWSFVLELRKPPFVHCS